MRTIYAFYTCLFSMTVFSKKPFTPKNEATRLKVLARCGILDTPAEPFFDDMILLASQILQAPIASLGFVDRERVWFKAERGLHIQEIPRAGSMCNAVIAQGEPLVVPDVTTDQYASEVFSKAYTSGIRFYVGVPVMTQAGHALGSLAVMDYQPRDPTADQMEALHVVGRQISAALESRGLEAEKTRVSAARKSLKGLSKKELRILQSLVDHLPDLIYIKDSRGRYVLNNVAHRRFLGVSRLEDVIGKTAANFFPKDLAKRYHRNDREVLSTGQPLLNRIEPIVDPTGEPREVSTSKIPLYSASGAIEGLLCIGRDICYCRETEETLQQERYQLHALMDNIPDNIYFKDRQGRFTRINNALARWFGLDDPSQALGKTDFDFFTEEHAREAYEDEQRIMATGKPIVAKEEKETWPDGHVTWVSTTKEPLRDREGNVIGSFGISRDITQLKEATLELAERDELNREEMSLARTIHRALMPVETPKVPGLEFGLLFVPSGDIGGDFIDFIRLPYPNRIGVTFADITGHGVGAALLSSMLKVLVDEVTHSGLSQSGCFKVLNRRLNKEYPPGSFASSFYAIFDTAGHTMTYVKASQEPVILLRPGEETQILRAGGPPLGLLGPDVFDEAEYEQHTVPLKPGDTVFFFTDGLVEHANGGGTKSVAQETLIAWLEEEVHRPPQELVDTIYERALAYVERPRPTDDVAALAVRVQY
ncbi:MAG: PAS domain-containing protein [Candidatus Pacebacteria bacterium]|nr:PAS domain-containing protein [Candidatus Paceibacterota bacterium]